MGGSGDGSMRRAVGDRAWRRWFLHRGEADGAVDGASRKLTQKLPDHRPSARGAQPFLGADQTFTAARSDQSGRTPRRTRPSPSPISATGRVVWLGADRAGGDQREFPAALDVRKVQVTAWALAIAFSRRETNTPESKRSST
jgi:hypothetical protein